MYGHGICRAALELPPCPSHTKFKAVLRFNPFKAKGISYAHQFDQSIFSLWHFSFLSKI